MVKQTWADRFIEKVERDIPAQMDAEMIVECIAKDAKWVTQEDKEWMQRVARHTIESMPAGPWMDCAYLGHSLGSRLEYVTLFGLLAAFSKAMGPTQDDRISSLAINVSSHRATAPERICFGTEGSGSACLTIDMQKKIGSYRADFLLTLTVSDYDDDCLPIEAAHAAVIECDGHDFRDRTKQQASRDRARDRFMQMQNIAVLRFTGSDIWNDPGAPARDAFAYLLQRCADTIAEKQTAALARVTERLRAAIEANLQPGDVIDYVNPGGDLSRSLVTKAPWFDQEHNRPPHGSEMSAWRIGLSGLQDALLRRCILVERAGAE